MIERTPNDPDDLESRDDEELLPTDDEPADLFEDPETPDLGDVDGNLYA
jgi:hypothetical protein